MNKLTTYLLLFTITLFICNPVNAQVSSHYDRNTNFAKYRTYTFLGWQKHSDLSIPADDQARILRALKIEFESRGMSIMPRDGNVRIALYVVLNERTCTAEYAEHLEQYGYGPQWGWGLGPDGDTTIADYSEIHYTEGTLVIDMYDAESNQMVWQAVVTDIVRPDPEDRDSSITMNISKLMQTYPVPQNK